MKRIEPFCAVVAGLVAGVLATLVQVGLWLLFTDGWPEVLWRDARLAAAIVLGPAVLPPPATFDLLIVIVATAVHFALSVAYGFAVALFANPARPVGVWLNGALFGGALYVVNMYGFTAIFPWFVTTRDPITLAAHLAFGVISALTYRRCTRKAAKAAKAAKTAKTAPTVDPARLSAQLAGYFLCSCERFHKQGRTWTRYNC